VVGLLVWEGRSPGTVKTSEIALGCNPGVQWVRALFWHLAGNQQGGARDWRGHGRGAGIREKRKKFRILQKKRICTGNNLIPVLSDCIYIHSVLPSKTLLCFLRVVRLYLFGSLRKGEGF